MNRLLRTHISLLVSVFFAIFLVPKQLAAQQIMLKGAIITPQSDNVPSFKVYYQGMQAISNEDGFFSFPLEQGKSDSYTLLITKDFKIVFDSVNTVKHCTVSPQKPYKFYTIQRINQPLLEQKIRTLTQQQNPISLRLRQLEKQITSVQQNIAYITMKNEHYQTNDSVTTYENTLQSLNTTRKELLDQLKELERETLIYKKKLEDLKNHFFDQRQGDYWIINQEKLDAFKFIVPQNCIHICLNPGIVERVENWNFGLGSSFLSFPRILLKKKLETKNIGRHRSLTRSALKSEVYSLESKIFHAPIKENLRVFDQKPEVKVALIR